MRPCTFEGCGRVGTGENGLCKGHKQQLYLRGTLAPLLPRGKHGNTAKGERHYRWNHDKLITSHGYVLLRVPEGHHLRQANGYAYEHQIIAEEMLGRRLEKGEIVRHKDNNPSNNAPENLLVRLRRTARDVLCDFCGKEHERSLYAMHSTESFCSKECYWKKRATRHIKALCDCCSKEYKTTLGRFAGQLRHHCSWACRQQAATALREADTVQCDFCGKESQRSLYKKKRLEAKEFFCSRPCFVGARAAARPCVVCDFCKKEYQTYPSRLIGVQRHYCSGECWRKGIAGGLDSRTGHRYNVWRRAVYRRDSFTCQDCSSIDGPFHAHHILQWAHYPESRFDVDNGITLCEPCHQKRHKFRFKPQVVGQMPLFPDDRAAPQPAAPHKWTHEESGVGVEA